MRVIAKSGELKIFAPENAWYSFFNSPYIGHKLGTALDIYFPEKALFPMESGIVEKIRNVRPPQRYVKGEDYLIAIRLNSSFCLKVLHVKPSVNIGDKLYLGDEIGDMIVSGFFMPWSSKHAHVELRKCDDYLRARGGIELMPVMHTSVPSTETYEFRIVEKDTHFCWALPLKASKFSLTPLSSGGNPIEGGLPHYGFGGVFSAVEEINILGQSVKVERKFGYGLFNFKTQLYANGKKIKGIGVYCNQPRIKIIGDCKDLDEKVMISTSPDNQD